MPVIDRVYELARVFEERAVRLRGNFYRQGGPDIFLKRGTRHVKTKRALVPLERARDEYRRDLRH